MSDHKPTSQERPHPSRELEPSPLDIEISRLKTDEFTQRLDALSKIELELSRMPANRINARDLFNPLLELCRPQETLQDSVIRVRACRIVARYSLSISAAHTLIFRTLSDPDEYLILKNQIFKALIEGVNDDLSDNRIGLIKHSFLTLNAASQVLGVIWLSNINKAALDIVVKEFQKETVFSNIFNRVRVDTANFLSAHKSALNDDYLHYIAKCADKLTDPEGRAEHHSDQGIAVLTPYHQEQLVIRLNRRFLAGNDLASVARYLNQGSTSPKEAISEAFDGVPLVCLAACYSPSYIRQLADDIAALNSGDRDTFAVLAVAAPDPDGVFARIYQEESAPQSADDFSLNNKPSQVGLNATLIEYDLFTGMPLAGEPNEQELRNAYSYLIERAIDSGIRIISYAVGGSIQDGASFATVGKHLTAEEKVREQAGKIVAAKHSYGNLLVLTNPENAARDGYQGKDGDSYRPNLASSIFAIRGGSESRSILEIDLSELDWMQNVAGMNNLYEIIESGRVRQIRFVNGGISIELLGRADSGSAAVNDPIGGVFDDLVILPDSSTALPELFSFLSIRTNNAGGDGGRGGAKLRSPDGSDSPVLSR